MYGNNLVQIKFICFLDQVFTRIYTTAAVFWCTVLIKYLSCLLHGLFHLYITSSHPQDKTKIITQTPKPTAAAGAYIYIPTW